MHRVEEVVEIKVISPEESSGINGKQFSILCAREGQSFLVKALGALGAPIVCVTSSNVVFEARGDEREIERLLGIVGRRWSIEEIPAAVAAIHA